MTSSLQFHHYDVYFFILILGVWHIFYILLWFSIVVTEWICTKFEPRFTARPFTNSSRQNQWLWWTALNIWAHQDTNSSLPRPSCIHLGEHALEEPSLLLELRSASSIFGLLDVFGCSFVYFVPLQAKLVRFSLYKYVDKEIIQVPIKREGTFRHFLVLIHTCHLFCGLPMFLF